MALSTEAAAVNTAVDTLVAAWKAYLDTLTAGDRIYLVGVNNNEAMGASAPTFSVNGTMRRVQIWKGTAQYFYRLEGEKTELKDLFFKVTDADGSLVGE